MVAIHDTYYYNSNKITDLTGWIGKIKKKLRREKHKNLRMEVILSNTLITAQIELRQKQFERKMKWINMKRTMDNEHQPAATFNADNCEDLIDLDNFMSKLKRIKQPVVR